MRYKRLQQLPLRRLLFLQQSSLMRAVICGIMYFEDKYNIPQQAKWLGVSSGTIHTYLHIFVDNEIDPEDYQTAHELIEVMRNPLYVTHW